MGGIVGLWSEESYDLAIVVLVASVCLPCVKFAALLWLLVSVHLRATPAMKQRALIHRILELVGHWSMLDVLVVGVVASLVQFQALGEINPRLGIYLFGLSVILTMLAAHQFDPRLIWDARGQEPTSVTTETYGRES